MRARKIKPLLTFVIDTREQWPYELGSPRRKEFEDGGTLRYALDAGDYSAELDGVLLPIRIERKMLGDFYGICGNGRERFAGPRRDPELPQPELERLRPYSSWLLIEATAQQVKAGYERSQISGETAMASALCFAVKFGVQVIFGGDRRTSQGICRRILEEYAVHHGLNSK